MQYIGDVTFAAQRDPIFSAGGFDLDTARVPYQGAATLKEAFTSGQVRFSSLSGYPKMYLMRWTDDEDPVFPTVTLEYMGFKSGSAPPEKAEDGQILQTVSVTVTSLTYEPGEEIEIAMDVVYFAQQTNYTWYRLTAPPSGSQFAVARRLIDPASSVLSRTYKIVNAPSSSGITQGRVSSVDAATYTQLNNELNPAHVVTEYKSDELVPGALWRCSATVNYQYNVT